MADQLFFSRDTKLFVEVGAGVFEIPVLDGYSFSQATNTTEVTLNEMSAGSGNSRRGRKLFTDSYAPGEWSFQTYARPFKSQGQGVGGSTYDASGTAGHHHAVEEVLWAMMVGDAAYTAGGSSAGNVATISGGTSLDAMGANKAGTSNFNVALTMDTDGDGDGCKLHLAYTASSGALSVAASGASFAAGAGYAATDKLFAGTAQIVAALRAGFNAAGSNGTFSVENSDITASSTETDFEATVASISASTNTSTFTGFTRDGTALDINFANSNKTTLGTGDFFFVMGSAGETQVVYKLHGCVVNEASLDFDIDGITTISWSGNCTRIEEVASATTKTVNEGIATTSNYIRNRLTELVISSTTPQSTTYSLTLTGGNITISNNITFLMPETLGSINTPLGHVTGTRSISGSFTCYLGADTNQGAQLFEDLVEDGFNSSPTITNDFDLTFKVGGAGNVPRLEMDMESCHLELPTHSIDDVISLETNFHALGTDIGSTDELAIKYVGAAIANAG